ncbi:hypothetical protein [Arenimonas caeni]|uniref:TonB C-terminal domain-containing protein n=1 Tax=Arenimonas caeni TaxID=2058085 RepID=A0A2P6M9C3_9GAMM|nr:hypothetical protein [Arenimonas caeni]PRH82590.1 hypothetical protein C6N40_07330 [Arenimonas caeni]
MRTILLACLLLAGPAATASEQSHFRATVKGELTIGTDGGVLEVRFDDAAWMKPPVREGYEDQIRSWRFEPILEDGKAVNAIGRMSLQLSAMRDDEAGRAEFRIDRAYFLDPEPADGAAGEDRAGLLRPPVYPADAARAGVGAFVGMVVRLDADGLPEQVAMEKLAFSGVEPRSHGRRLATQFEKATLAAARSWRFPGYEAGQVLRVPVTYSPPRFPAQSAGWVQVFPTVREVPAWVLAEHGARQPVELAASGERGSERLRLLTPLSPEG